MSIVRRGGRSVTARLTAALAVLALAATACGGSGEQPTIVKAVFEDVGSLPKLGTVKVSDVEAGQVTDIELTPQYEGLVTMEIRPGVDLPADVSAELRKTSVLGEQFVGLVPQGGGGEFESGSVITDTQTVPTLQEAVGRGNEVLAAVAADKLAGAIEAGSRGLDGRGGTLRSTIDDFTEIVSRYDDNSQDLVRLINGFDRFAAEVAPRAELHGRALAEFKRFTEVIREEDTRLLDTLNEVRDLAVTGSDIIQQHRERMDAFFRRFEILTNEFTQEETAFDQLFTTLSAHNSNTFPTINQEFVQLLADFLICGENSRPGDPVRACENYPKSRPKPDPRPPQEY
jgi:phospholipid/cholesterol/gamma-HCH transport system substrate-binding protein